MPIVLLFTSTAFYRAPLSSLILPMKGGRSSLADLLSVSLQPPITFQPQPPPGSNPSANTSAQQAKQAGRPKQPDLITRYNLQNKLSSESEEGTPSEEKKKEGWSSNKDERQALLKKRRDEMILAARRKMEAKIAAEKAAAGDAGS